MYTDRGGEERAATIATPLGELLYWRSTLQLNLREGVEKSRDPRKKVQFFESKIQMECWERGFCINYCNENLMMLIFLRFYCAFIKVYLETW